MRIVMTKKFRKNLVMVLNLIRSIIFVVGGLVAVFGGMGLDSIGVYGEIAIKIAFFGLGLIFSSMIIELFTVNCLVHDGEYMNTIFDFACYGLKNRHTYREYIREIKRQQYDEELDIIDLDDEHDNDNVIQLDKYRIG